MLDALRIRREAWIFRQLCQVEGVAEAGPNPLAGRCHDQIAVARLETLKRNDAGMRVAPAPGDFAADQIVAADVDERRNRGFQKRAFDFLANSAPFAREQS